MARWAGLIAIVLALGTAGCSPEYPETLAAVATNFDAPMTDLVRAFEATGEHRISITSGSTGKLHAQIRSGAPFDLFLAADAARPALLESQGSAVSGSRFTYAVGELVWWEPGSSERGSVGLSLTERLGALEHGERLALANPELAPYGRAAAEVLESLGLRESLADRLVYGENVGQAYTLVASGAATAGLLAGSQFALHEVPADLLAVPAGLHRPVEQQAVLLTHGADNPTARAFLNWLHSAEARAVIERHGYTVP